MRLPRRSALLALPLLVGTVLLMHGMEARPSAPAAASGSAAVVPHAHDDRVAAGPHDAAAHHDGACDDCASHLMAACLAVLATVTALRASRNLRRPAAALRTAAVATWRARRALIELVRSPDPAWVRFAVMCC